MSLLNILNIWNTVIMTILMCSSSNIYVSSELISINWLFSTWVIFLYLFVCLVIFVWMPDIVKFALLDAGYFCIPINILELYSGMLS